MQLEERQVLRLDPQRVQDTAGQRLHSILVNHQVLRDIKARLGGILSRAITIVQKDNQVASVLIPKNVTDMLVLARLTVLRILQSVNQALRNVHGGMPQTNNIVLIAQPEPDTQDLQEVEQNHVSTM